MWGGYRAGRGQDEQRVSLCSRSFFTWEADLLCVPSVPLETPG